MESQAAEPNRLLKLLETANIKFCERRFRFFRRLRPRDAQADCGRGLSAGLAHPFNERLELGFPKQILQAIVERVSGRALHLRPRRHQVVLNRVRSPHRIADSRQARQVTELGSLDFVNGLLILL
jgi:hypothetical protein